MSAVPKPGLYRDASRALYESWEAANYSRLKHYERSPEHAREWMLHPPEPSPAMFRGEVVHAAILEPETFSAGYVAAPVVDRRTKDGKATWAAFEAQHAAAQLVPAEMYEDACRMAEAVWNNPFAKELLGSKGSAESSAVWEDADTGQPCKGRLDRIGRVADTTFVADLKTCRDARPERFARDAANLYYHAQAAFYMGGLYALSALQRRFVWICVESDRPHGVTVLEPTEAMMEAGRAKCAEWLRVHAECVKNGYWPGYPAEPQFVDLPAWATKREEW